MAKMSKKECWTNLIGLSSLTLLFFVAHIGKIVFAMDGCKFINTWRCGDQCTLDNLLIISLMKFIHVENMVVLLIFCSRGLN